MSITGLYNLAFVLNAKGHLDEAERLLRQDVELSREVYGAEHRKTLEATSQLASVLINEGRPDEAEVLLRHCLDLQGRLLGANSPDAQTTRRLLDAARNARGRPPEKAAPGVH